MFFSLGLANFGRIAHKFHSEFFQQIFPVNFSALFLQGFRPPPKKIHTPNSRPKLSAFLSNFIQETAKDPNVEGSRSYQSSVTPIFRGTKAPKTLVSLCFGAIREGRMIPDRSLLTS